MSGKFIGDLTTTIIKGLTKGSPEEVAFMTEMSNANQENMLLLLHRYRWVVTIFGVIWMIISLVVYYQAETDTERNKIEYTNKVVSSIICSLCLTWVLAFSLFVMIPTMNNFMEAIIIRLTNTIQP